MTIRVAWHTGPREELAPLFAEADDSAEAVATYRDLGRVLVATQGGRTVGQLQLVAGDEPRSEEVKSLAVLPEVQGAGVGTALLARAADEARRAGHRTLLVATAAADTRVLRFYQLSGFRLLRVERDVFTPDRGYPPVDVGGIPLRDQVWLSLTLDG